MQAQSLHSGGERRFPSCSWSRDVFRSSARKGFTCERQRLHPRPGLRHPLLIPSLSRRQALTEPRLEGMGQSLSTWVSKQWARGKGSRESQAECVFCKIAAEGKQSERIIYQDESVVVFPDRSPAAAAHILVIPREHIAHGYCLKPCSEDRRLGIH
mmetsp:Transcript_29280/g.52356  ORF Transcript_29280/g.52356 Transcript_29280/m.52356 type:complete len:156 (-) Transcript_29280:665-1132(-)